jgi:hypothetical protein
MRRDTVDAWALEDLACFTTGTHTIAFNLPIRIGSCSQRKVSYLSLSTGFAVHGLARFGSDSAGSEPVDADGGASNSGGHDELMIDRIETQKDWSRHWGRPRLRQRKRKRERKRRKREEGEEEEKKEEKDEDQLN